MTTLKVRAISLIALASGIIAAMGGGWRLR